MLAGDVASRKPGQHLCALAGGLGGVAIGRRAHVTHPVAFRDRVHAVTHLVHRHVALVAEDDLVAVEDLAVHADRAHLLHGEGGEET